MEKKRIKILITRMMQNHDTGMEIVGQVIRESLPEEASQHLFQAINMCLNDVGIRHRSFNQYQMRKYGCSRIN